MAIRMAQWGTRHGHAAGKMLALRSEPDVELVGYVETDPVARGAAARSDAYRDVPALESAASLLEDRSLRAIAVEGANHESLAMAIAAVEAGKDVWLDKPAGDDWAGALRLFGLARERGLLVQLGYMFRFHTGFRALSSWARSGLLGEVYAIRAQMSATWPASHRQRSPGHRGGVFYDLGGHVLDQIVWILGRPRRVTSFLRNDASPDTPAFADNTLVVLDYDRAIAHVDIAALEPGPTARRIEVYGTRGSAIMEPLDGAREIRLCLDAARDGYQAGVQLLPVVETTRQRSYELELSSFVRALQGKAPPERSLDHELLVQETLLRATGAVPGP